MLSSILTRIPKTSLKRTKLKSSWKSIVSSCLLKLLSVRKKNGRMENMLKLARTRSSITQNLPGQLSHPNWKMMIIWNSTGSYILQVMNRFLYSSNVIIRSKLRNPYFPKIKAILKYKRTKCSYTATRSSLQTQSKDSTWISDTLPWC